LSKSCTHLRVELLLVGLHVDGTLELSRGSSNLEAGVTLSNGGVELVGALDTDVLEGVTDTSNEVWNELGDGATVGNGTGDTLGNEDGVTLGEVAGGTGVGSLGVLVTSTSLLVLHGVDGTHSTVGLDELTLAGDEGSSWGLSGTSEETTHHDGGGTKSKTLDD